MFDVRCIFMNTDVGWEIPVFHVTKLYGYDRMTMILLA